MISWEGPVNAASYAHLTIVIKMFVKVFLIRIKVLLSIFTVAASTTVVLPVKLFPQITTIYTIITTTTITSFTIAITATTFYSTISTSTFTILLNYHCLRPKTTLFKPQYDLKDAENSAKCQCVDRLEIGEALKASLKVIN